MTYCLSNTQWILLIVVVIIVIAFILYFTCGNNHRQYFNQIEPRNYILYNFDNVNCPYARNFKPVWNTVIPNLPTNINSQIIDVNADENSDLMRHYNVTGTPTIILEISRGPIEYRGPVTARDFHNFIVKNTSY